MTNLKQLAEDIGVSRTSLYSFIKELDLDKDNLTTECIDKIKERAKKNKIIRRKYNYNISLSNQHDLLKLIELAIKSNIKFEVTSKSNEEE